MILSRRQLGRFLSGALVTRWAFPGLASASPSSFHVDRLLEEHPYEVVTDQFRMYRADAVISLLGINVFSRSGVGNGFCGFRQTRRGDTTVSISRFAGGSFPQKARNLNRLGFIQEVVVEKDSAPTQAAYFGFMTASPEEGVNDAKHALDAKEFVQYVAAEGLISPTHFRATKTRFLFPNKLTWADRKSIFQQVRSEFSKTESDVKDLNFSGAQWPGTILHQLATAVRRHPAKFEAGYVYNAKHFVLKLEKVSDPKAAAALAAKGLVSKSETVAQFRGVIHDGKTGKLTKFRFWTEEESGTLMPLRIELQARSFLALAFEFDPKLQSSKESQEL